MVPFNSELEWFQENSTSLRNFISKAPVKDEVEKNIKGRLLTKLLSAEKFIVSHNDPFYKEVTFLIYWSCLNEFIHQNFYIPKPNEGNVYFKNKKYPENVVVENSKSNYYYIKAKPKYELNNFYNLIYRLKDETKTIVDKGYITHPSFLVSIYLNNISYPNYRKQSMFSYLSFKRNKLSLIHDDEIAIATRQFKDKVHISDCVKILQVVHYLLRNTKTTHFRNFTKNKRPKNISGVVLGTIVSINENYVELKFDSGIIEKYSISEQFWESFSINDFVELDFEKDKVDNINKVKDIILLF